MTPLTKLQVPCTSTHVATGSPALLTCVQRLYGNTQQTWAYAKTPHSSRAGQMWTQPAQQEIRLKVLQSSLNFRGKMRHFKHTHTQKVSETAPVKLSRCNFFCSNQTLLVISYPNQNNTDENNLLTEDAFFFLKICLPIPFLCRVVLSQQLVTSPGSCARSPCTTAAPQPPPGSSSWSPITELKKAGWIFLMINMNPNIQTFTRAMANFLKSF